MSTGSAQKSRLATKVDNWSEMFPTKLETQQASLLYVKKMLTVGISTISYLRSMFHEEAYSRKSLNGLQLRIIK